MDIKVDKSKKLNGIIEIPADKSITHRAFMFSALTKGKCKISNYSKGADCMSTLKIIQQLGCKVEFINENELIIDSKDIPAPVCLSHTNACRSNPSFLNISAPI